MNRSKDVYIEVEGVKEIFDGIISMIQPFVNLWKENRESFFSRICTILNVPLTRTIEVISEKYMIDPFNARKWEEMGFSVDQVYLFVIGQIWDAFYKKQVKKAYAKLSFEHWIENEGKIKLANEYSLLSNLQYIRELGLLVGHKSSSLETLISLFCPLSERGDYESYLKEVENIKIPKD